MMSAEAGSYRESGSVGFTHYQRAAEAARRTMPEPSWFAYAVDGLSPQVLHEVEVDYPDDAERSAVLALRDEAPLSYPVSSGVDTGGEFTLTHRMQRHSILFWPRGTKTRIVIMNVHDGRRAAAARLRVYRRGDVPLPSIASGGRQVLQWYEEGNNFHSVVGTPDPHRYEWRALPRRIGIERWIRLSRYGGANVLAPTVGVYSFGLYPSNFNRSFSTPDVDELRLMLLLAEKHGMRVIPELHPRADELDWPFARAGHPRPHLLWSRAGKTSFFQRDGKTRNVPPHYNPIHPSNQEWYVGHIAELVNRYRDSPALQGISVRLMPWANASLNNFVSLQWGYDDFSVNQFVQDTTVALPASLLAASKNADDAARQTIVRHQWIMRHARAAWIAWRCAKITALFARIRD